MKSTLQNKGWIEFQDINSEKQLIEICENFGKIIPHPNGNLIDILTPKESKDAKSLSFSKNFGLNKFPFHTDTAFLNNPVKYMALFSEETNDCPTLLLNFSSVLDNLDETYKKDIFKAIYGVQTPNNNFLSLLYKPFQSEFIIRYDECCMKPLNKSAKRIDVVLKKIFIDLTPIEINWTKGKLVIVDNWKFLHSRNAVNSSINRKLKRIYIN
ncbi:hypothetical protein C3729_07580 [Cloacibacterium normanense]|uniref:TauD/TfdA-like domain-containing protein n=1 Tax=Cloacibacterium normanense TaxID=237258 RepID=A0A2S7I5Q9_9FLAO|nr:TauD/TfdA family dioxygenase [Cloacibacterium normanense]PPZ91908.1 hypothetical protein C3729_07580 [Cloacibacterium normanense]